MNKVIITKEHKYNTNHEINWRVAALIRQRICTKLHERKGARLHELAPASIRYITLLSMWKSSNHCE